MLDSILSYTSETPITLMMAIIGIFVSFGAGAIISLTYMKTHEKGKHSQNFALTIVLLPAIIATIIMLIGSDIAKAFSLAGAFSIIRFRSAPGDPKDIAYVLFSMATGLAAGVSLYAFSILFSVILCSVMFVLNKINFGGTDTSIKKLKVIIPEDLDYESTFNPLFDDYTDDYTLTHVKTSAMGSLYQLTYDISIKKSVDIKSFMDEIRIRNGNLNISLNMIEDTSY